MNEFKNVNIARLIALILNQDWHSRCQVIPNYMPPYPDAETRPSAQVRYNNGTEYPPFLRYSCGPKQCFFWDIYGDDMQSVELAIIALSNAPYPCSVAPMVVKFPIHKAYDVNKGEL